MMVVSSSKMSDEPTIQFGWFGGISNAVFPIEPYRTLCSIGTRLNLNPIEDLSHTAVPGPASL